MKMLATSRRQLLEAGEVKQNEYARNLSAPAPRSSKMDMLASGLLSSGMDAGSGEVATRIGLAQRNRHRQRRVATRTGLAQRNEREQRKLAVRSGLAQRN